MNRLRRFIAAFAIMALALSITASPNEVTRVIAIDYDLDSTTDISCVYQSKPAERRVLIATSGSSTTTAAVTATSQPFAPLAVGDALYVQPLPNTTATMLPPILNLVTAKASDDSITVGDAWTIPAAGRTFSYIKRTCGATSGWISTEGLTSFNIWTYIDQLNIATGAIGFKIEGRSTDQTFYQKSTNLWPGDAAADAHCGGGTYASGYCTYTTTAQNIPVFTQGNVAFPTQVRLVMILTGTDDGGDTGANAEKIISFFIGGR